MKQYMLAAAGIGAPISLLVQSLRGLGGDPTIIFIGIALIVTSLLAVHQSR